MRRTRRLKNEINVVPYIDVMLVLLVIFMVAAPMMQTGNVDLPTVENADTLPAHPLRVEINAQGDLTLRDAEGARHSFLRAELAEQLKNARARNPESPLLIAGDKAAQYEFVLQVLDEAKKQGFARVGLETARP
ncbi:MAG: protein TolR [Zoogloeaceae bacterium]|jgi:biopolymer transport protein TolR|nr:protein TolR [Zoogloeaceae bacterium]